MTITVRYFAVLRDRRGLPEESLSGEFSTVRALVDSLIDEYQLDLPSVLIRVAQNGAFVADDALVKDGDVIVLIPPVAGG